MAACRHLVRCGNSNRIRWAWHTYTVLSEIPDSDGEAFRVRYLYRITEGGEVISEEDLTGYFYHPAWDVLQGELTGAGFTQTEETEGLLTWRLA